MVVIGSSFIGMELVAAVAKRKLASIHVIGMEEVPFEVVLGKEIGKGLQKVKYFQPNLPKQPSSNFRQSTTKLKGLYST
jgi:hypothetical protein